MRLPTMTGNDEAFREGVDPADLPDNRCSVTGRIHPVEFVRDLLAACVRISFVVIRTGLWATVTTLSFIPMLDPRLQAYLRLVRLNVSGDRTVWALGSSKKFYQPQRIRVLWPTYDGLCNQSECVVFPHRKLILADSPNVVQCV